MSGPYSFLVRVLLVFVGIIALVVIGKQIMTPDSWGEYGYYRGDYIKEEASRALVHGTNESCKSCHEEVYELKDHSTHKRLSCEACHAPVAEHAKDGNKFADMPVRRGEAQVSLCLKCHQKIVGRPVKFPMIEHPQHLEAQNVKTTHTCDQCHTVHAPLENIKHVKDMRSSLKEAVDEK